ncbi:MAG: hypothetical protein JOZ83_08735 [Silvibacterium sp.]|nr:hypothetical protein [Silvibacterium sp.]
MVHISRRSLSASLVFVSVALFACGGAAGVAQSAESPAPAQAATPAQADRAPWRSLHRKMSKDEVRHLLGEPTRVSVSRFYESWDYLRGTVTFDSKGRLDAWSEL